MNADNQMTRCMEMLIREGEMAGVSLLALREGREILYASAGHADVEAQRPIARSDIFRMYSQTKAVTAAATVLLAQRGQLDLEAPVEKFLPGFRGQKVLSRGKLVPARRPSTVMDLLGMSAGLCGPGADGAGKAAAELYAENERMMDEGRGMDTLEFLNRLGRLPLAFQPGAQFRYSTCADVLGGVIEVVSKRRFDEFLRDEFFEPLGMADTDFYVPPQKRARLVTCYERTPGGLVPVRPHNSNVRDFSARPAYISGGGGLFSTIDDYAAFATMLLMDGCHRGARILAPESVRFLRASQLPLTPEYRVFGSMNGLGYGKLMRQCENPGWFPGFARKGEYGWDGWLGTYFANFPNERLSVLMMMNVMGVGTSSPQRRMRNVLLADLSLREL